MARCVSRVVVQYDIYIQFVIVIDDDYDAKNNNKNENKEDWVSGWVT